MSLSEQLTFIIHIRVDHADRLQNLQAILSYYSNAFPLSRFVIIEDNYEHDSRLDAIVFPKGKTTYLLLQNEGVYHRTKAFNIGANEAKTPFISTIDTDCILHTEPFDLCLKEMSQNGVGMAWPYNGLSVDVRGDTRSSFIQSLEISTISKAWYECLSKNKAVTGSVIGDFCIWSPQSVGGIVIYDKEVFKGCGGYNEVFRGWGYEDNEIQIRFHKLGIKQHRYTQDDGVLFHLSHQHSTRDANPFYSKNHAEATLIESLTPTQIQAYISTWQRIWT